ncbi:ATP synthase F1 subunit delta [Spirulina sp. CS-785/01]|uniref:ATP synthase F1 subunit delta n=1 Tax=Spirulina sp. CS-785/01 TaxID=3021716 RepID=UPI00232BBA24|nr:ATP synthase F1 subunit delta [Spirulina sp. CS-785/01]MDB9311843.1 ATP synthase F1 subunit delta [Spirulina sp. CS-785/01]
MPSNLISSEIAEPYAQALMSLAQTHDLTETFGRDFRDLGQLLDDSPELQDFIANPVISDNDKKEILGRIMGDSNHYLMNFLMLLIDKRRIVFLRPIVEQYLALLRDLNNVVLAEVTSTRELNDEQRRNIEDRVKGMTGAQGVEIKTTIDPDIIGGVIIKVGSQVIDASLRGQLRRIGISLKV